MPEEGGFKRQKERKTETKYGNGRDFLKKVEVRFTLYGVAEVLNTYDHGVGQHILWRLIVNKGRKIIE